MPIYDNILEKLSLDDDWSAKNEAVSIQFKFQMSVERYVCMTRNLEALLEPFTYISSAPGKEIRTSMIHAFNAWLNVSAEQLGIIAKLVNMMHSASLL